MSLKFKPEDFKALAGPGQGGPNVNVCVNVNPVYAILIAQKAQALFDAWLERQPKVYKVAKTNTYWTENSGPTFVAGNDWADHTHSARLVDIKEVEK